MEATSPLWKPGPGRRVGSFPVPGRGELNGAADRRRDEGGPLLDATGIQLGLGLRPLIDNGINVHVGVAILVLFEGNRHAILPGENLLGCPDSLFDISEDAT